MINSGKNWNDSEDNSEVDYTLNSMIYPFKLEKIQFFNHSNANKMIMDNNEWLSEKPISILQLDSADRAVLKIAGTKIIIFFF